MVEIVYKKYLDTIDEKKKENALKQKRSKKEKSSCEAA